MSGGCPKAAWSMPCGGAQHAARARAEGTVQFQLVDSGGNVVAQSAALPLQPEGGSARRLLQTFASTATFSPNAGGLPAGAFRVVVAFSPSGSFKPARTALTNAPTITVVAGARPARAPANAPACAEPARGACERGWRLSDAMLLAKEKWKSYQGPKAPLCTHWRLWEHGRAVKQLGSSQQTD